MWRCRTAIAAAAAAAGLSGVGSAGWWGIDLAGVNALLDPMALTLLAAAGVVPVVLVVGEVWGVHEQQLEWLKKDVAKVAPTTPVVIFTHSPLWDYYPRWNFQVSDSKEVRDILAAKFQSDLDGIGATEMIHIFISHTPERVRRGATGYAIPGYRARVIDEIGRAHV